MQETVGGSPPAGAPTKRKKRPYNRHPKAPYTYLALIALVITAAPGRMLRLPQIAQQIRWFFPSFQINCNTIRRNLSMNACFKKVLEDPVKRKGNYWTVDVDRIPPKALKLQDTAVSHQGEMTFAPDLSPFVLLGHPYIPPGGFAPLKPLPAEPLP